MLRESNQGLGCRLLLPDGTEASLLVDAERASVGSGSHCEVKLPIELVPREIVVLQIQGDRVRFHVTAPQPLCRLSGRVVSEGELGPQDLLEVGPIKLAVAAVDLGKVRARFPIELAAMIPVAFAIILTAIWTQRPTVEGPPRPPPAPSLFTDGAAGCPSSEALEAAHLGKSKLKLALTMRERGPFAPQDAVSSVKLFEGAATCFGAAHDEEAASAARRDAAEQRKQLEEEYLLRRTRLEHAALESDSPSVARELRVLIPMTSHMESGVYVDWLRQLSRWSDS